MGYCRKKGTSRSPRGWFSLLQLLALVCSCNTWGQELSVEEQSWLESKGEVVFVSQSLYPPFEFVDNDQSRAGMCLELVRWIATEFGMKARFRDMPFKAAQRAVLAGEADVITSLFFSEERDLSFDFSQMTWEVPALIFVDRARPDITHLPDLQGKRVAMQHGDYAAEFLKSKQIDYELVSTATFAEAVNLVVAGEADAVIGDEQIVLYHLFSNKLTKRIKSVGAPLYTGQNSLGLKQGAVELQSILNKGIDLARERGVFSTIARKWTGTIYELPVPWYVQYRLQLLLVFGGLLALFALILFWNAQLRRTVQGKTEDLRKSEAHLRTLINTLPDLIWLKDPDGIYLGCNPRFERFFGAKESEIIGKTDYDFVGKELADFFRKHDRNAVAAGRSVVNEEEVVYADDGHRELLEAIKTPMYGDDGVLIGVLGIARDITERENMAIRLQQASKMEAIGHLAGGVAHDLNNILSGLVSYPELLLMQLPEKSRLRHSVEVIQESGIRASAIVADLLTVARGVAAGREVANLNSLIEQYLGSPEYDTLKDLHQRVRCTVQLDPDLLNLCCSPVHVVKCIMNLVTNAVEAVQGEGAVEIATQNRYLEYPLVEDQYLEKGEYVVVRVSDTGLGISEEDRERIFEPFYTRKMMGRSGTGLGLYIVWNTVHDHHGAIVVDSGESGTTMELFFPASREGLAARSEGVKLESLKGKREQILVVDDEQLQREVAAKMLESLNYTVDTVRSGEEALDYLDQGNVDLVLLDMLMAPGINGRQTYEQILTLDPGQKVIIASGFSEHDEVKATIRLGASGFINKPYTMETIGRALKEVLAG
ncbi:response regulator [Desulfogranum mediterraneum]|uniref:response regulator n=1 Tax=Desulfogranum mediterraneum TaxID=160661 RepID=UPI000404F254|nr:transporter substrate-binding domain-containing protein [Desulfogranum mediterraneum]